MAFNINGMTQHIWHILYFIGKTGIRNEVRETARVRGRERQIVKFVLED